MLYLPYPQQEVMPPVEFPPTQFASHQYPSEGSTTSLY